MSKPAKNTICIWYDRNVEEAAQFYQDGRRTPSRLDVRRPHRRPARREGPMKSEALLDRIADGRTDLVWDYIAQGHPATAVAAVGVPLVQWCAHYGDVSAMRFLLERGESLASLGVNLGLAAAAFHGHWQLGEFLVEHGADVNGAADETAETPLHAAPCTPNRASTTNDPICGP